MPVSYEDAVRKSIIALESRAKEIFEKIDNELTTNYSGGKIEINLGVNIWDAPFKTFITEQYNKVGWDVSWRYEVQKDQHGNNIDVSVVILKPLAPPKWDDERIVGSGWKTFGGTKGSNGWTTVG